MEIDYAPALAAARKRLTDQITVITGCIDGTPAYKIVEVGLIGAHQQRYLSPWMQLEQVADALDALA